MGIRPFKIEVNLPNQVYILPKDINIACSKQGVTTFPEGLAEGVFNFVRKTATTRIYSYQFRKRVGCRAIKYDVHGRLPILIHEQLQPTELLKYRTENMHGIGNLINGGDAEKFETVDVKDGKVYSTYCNGYEQGNDTESTVQYRMLQHLNQIESGSGSLTASITPNTECKISQFSGGGDILINLDSENSLLTLNPRDFDEEDTESPVYSDEVRSDPNIELKHKPKEDVEHIELQLRANMMLCLARQLDSLLGIYSLEDLTLLNTMSVYGVTFGYRSLHLLLKLTVHFKNRTTITQVQYKRQSSVPWAVEASIAYIMVSKMRAKRVAATTPTTTPTPPPT